MKSDFAPAPAEQLIRKERVHPGVFSIPVGALVIASLAEVAILLLLKLMGQMMSQVLPGGQPADLGLLPIILMVLPLIPTLGLALILLPTFLNSETTLTSSRLIYRMGFLSLVAGELPLMSIEATFIREPLLGRLLGYGTIIVSTTGGLHLPLRFIRAPGVFYNALQSAIANARCPGSASPKRPIPAVDDSRYMPAT